MSEMDDGRSAEDFYLAASVANRTTLQDVRLVRGSFELHSLDLPAGVDVEVRPAGANWGQDGTALQFEMGFRTVLGEPTSPVFTAEVALLATYELDGDDEIDDDVAAAFGNVSVTYAVYPYLREFLQSTTTRVGLEPLTVAPLRTALDEVLKLLDLARGQTD